MTSYSTQDRGSSRPLTRWSALAVASVVALAACSDSNVPFFVAPTSVAASPGGVQNAITGLFSATRIDLGGFVTTVGAGYSRDGAEFLNTEARTVEYPLGVFPTPTSSGGDWVQEYQNILQAQQILATLPKVTPAYSSAATAAITGVVQTVEAYNYMILAEAHDTLGAAILPVGLTSSANAPAFCNPDVWKYTIALLDSANASLTTAGATPIPITMPTGFAGVSATAAPASAAGSFASFNRALAAKANLELAYAIARQVKANAPTPSSPGSPTAGSGAAALATAMADLTGSAMYNPAALAPEAPTFSASPTAVMFDFSGTSGDIVNPIQGELALLAQLNDFVADVDTLHDLRWKTKFALNPHSVQQQFYNPVASKYIPTMYPSPSSTLPIVREVELVLWHAQILIGQANYAAALADINNVRATLGGPSLTPYPASDALSYVTIRNDLMREQRISTTWEGSVDRTIAIRMYGLALVSDTTWTHEDPNVKSADAHTTVNPIPFAELTARGGTMTTTCSVH
jgi:hypothetical protein